VVQDGDSARTAALSQLLVDAPGVVTEVVMAGVVATMFPETADIAVRIPHLNPPVCKSLQKLNDAFLRVKETN
jgi:hypothetical protein